MDDDIFWILIIIMFFPLIMLVFAFMVVLNSGDAETTEVVIESEEYAETEKYIETEPYTVYELDEYGYVKE